MVALFVCLGEHINRKDCRHKAAPEAGRRGSAGNVHGAEMTRRSGIRLLEEKEFPFALKRIITFSVSVLPLCCCCCGLKPHPGMTATRGRKLHHWFDW